jgi:hypothetical protein
MLTSIKDLKKILRDAEGRGWEFTLTKGNHIKGKHADGKVVTISRTPSDWRVLTNIKGDLKNDRRREGCSPRPVGGGRPV